MPRRAWASGASEGTWAQPPRLAPPHQHPPARPADQPPPRAVPARRTAGPVLVEDGVHLGVADVGVLRVKRVAGRALLGPGQLAVGAAAREAVVADAADDLVAVHDAGAHLREGSQQAKQPLGAERVLGLAQRRMQTATAAPACQPPCCRPQRRHRARLLVGVLGPLRAEEGHRHEVVVPRQVAAGQQLWQCSAVVSAGGRRRPRAAAAAAAATEGSRGLPDRPGYGASHSVRGLGSNGFCLAAFWASLNGSVALEERLADSCRLACLSRSAARVIREPAAAEAAATSSTREPCVLSAAIARRLLLFRCRRDRWRVGAPAAIN